MLGAVIETMADMKSPDIVKAAVNATWTAK